MQDFCCVTICQLHTFFLTTVNVECLKLILCEPHMITTPDINQTNCHSNNKLTCKSLKSISVTEECVRHIIIILGVRLFIT